MKKSNPNMRPEQLESRQLMAASLLADLAGNSMARARDMGVLGSAVEVTLRDSVQKVGRKSDVDYYRFQITEQQTIRLTLTGLRADVDLRLNDADGNRVASSAKAGRSPEMIRRTLEAGTYYVKVSGWGSARTNYTLKASAAATEATPVITPEAASSGVSIELGASGRLKITGTDGDDLITLRQINGQIGLVGAARMYPASQVKAIAVNAGAGDDVISLKSQFTAGQESITSMAVVDGHEGNDTIYGGEGDDVLLGGLGNDLILGIGGNDAIGGGEGNDQLFGGFGEDLIDGGDGADKIWGELGNDTLAGQGGDDELWGAEDDDRLEGGDGADKLGGSAGNDVILAGGGGDTVYGDDGDDRIDAGGGLDSVWGGAGNDAIVGGDDVDQLIGGDGQDTIVGGAGADRIWGEGGGDVLCGDDGNDVIYGGDNGDALHGGAGADLLAGGEGNDDLYGDRGDDSLYGEGGDDDFNDSFGAAFYNNDDWSLLSAEQWYVTDEDLLILKILTSAYAYVPQAEIMPQVVLSPQQMNSAALDPIVSGAIFDASGYGSDWAALARDTIHMAWNLPNMYRRPLTPS